ncbi:hypothetical protein ETB97_006135 [Aspergillus alliaceus]|uniref:Uncharacterized protein n=1 Tax=Petromyces alliaceus TaxID=209559 RepID=A0A8H6AEM5_PETAA|nr:hypothetical protein ETB97_006135 [Aspergillus burnettii]
MRLYSHVEDTLYAISGLGFVDTTSDDLYSANTITKLLAAMPSTEHGALISEALLGAAFLMRKLKADNFKYPFKELDTPYQYAYQLMGQEELSKQHTYSIMAAEGRLDSFNHFMVGKIMKASKRCFLSYHGRYCGGRGEPLLDIKAAYPELQASDLAVQAFNQDIIEVSGVTLATWNYKEENSPQPVKGALIHHLAYSS